MKNKNPLKVYYAKKIMFRGLEVNGQNIINERNEDYARIIEESVHSLDNSDDIR